MSRKFTITTPTNLSRAGAEGRVQVQFTVANTSGAPERRLFRAVPLGDAHESWLALAGESERTFAADGVHQLSVTASVPPGTAAGRYGFRLDCIAASRTGEEIEEGPAVYFDVAASAPPKKSMAWLWIAAAIVLVVAGAGTWLLLRPAGPAAAAPTESVADTAPVESIDVGDVATPQLYVADAIRKLQADGFRTKLKFEQNDDATPGAVIAQSVAPNGRAPRGSAIELTVATPEDESMSLSEADEQDLSASAAGALHEFFLQQRRVDVPDVMGQQMSAVAAIRTLQIYGLRVELRSHPYTSASPGMVVSQQPDPKTEVRVGTPVVVFVAVNGPADLSLSPEQQAHLDPEGERRLSDMFRSMEVAMTDTAATSISATSATFP